MSIVASDWKPLERNTLKGYVTLELPSGLKLIDCTYHVHPSGKRWVGLPSRPQTNKDGSPRIDPKTNKPAWLALVQIPDKERHAALQTAALAAMDALTGGAR